MIMNTFLPGLKIISRRGSVKLIIRIVVGFPEERRWHGNLGTKA